MQKLLLIHGAIGSADQFQLLSGQLRDDFEIHTLNLPGHGKDPRIDQPFTIAAFTAYVHEWIAQRFSEPISIFGYSLGGYIALNLAALHPEQVHKVMTFATIFGWNEQVAAAQVKLLDSEKIKQKVPAFAQQLSDTHGAEKWEQVLQKTAGMLIHSGQAPLLTPEVLGGIHHRVCITTGDRDQAATPEDSLTAYRALPQADLMVLPRTVHPIEKLDTSMMLPEIKRFFLS